MHRYIYFSITINNKLKIVFFYLFIYFIYFNFIKRNTVIFGDFLSTMGEGKPSPETNMNGQKWGGGGRSLVNYYYYHYFFFFQNIHFLLFGFFSSSVITDLPIPNFDNVPLISP